MYKHIIYNLGMRPKFSYNIQRREFPLFWTSPGSFFAVGPLPGRCPWTPSGTGSRAFRFFHFLLFPSLIKKVKNFRGYTVHREKRENKSHAKFLALQYVCRQCSVLRCGSAAIRCPVTRALSLSASERARGLEQVGGSVLLDRCYLLIALG